MEDALKLLTAHLARQKAATNTNDIRALNDMIRRDYIRDEQVGDKFQYWVDLLPADQGKWDEFRRTIVVENLLRPCMDRFVMGMLGTDWEWGITPPGATEPLPPDNEMVQAGATWHADAGLWALLRAFALEVLTLEEGASLRVYIPESYGTDDNPLNPGSVGTWAEAFEIIHNMVLTSSPSENGQGGILRDDFGREIAGYYLYSINGADGKPETRLELQTPDKITTFKQEGAEFRQIRQTDNPLYDPTRLRRPRFLIHEARRDGGSAITTTARDLQNDYNVALSQRRRNTTRAGFRQWVTIDALDPTDAAGNPVPWTLSGRVVASVKSLTQDEDGNPIDPPLKASIQVFDPVDTNIINSHLESTKRDLLGYYDQLWTVQGEGNISGESRRESRTAFEKRIALEHQPIKRAAEWLIETAFALAGYLTGKQSEVAGLKATARLFLDSQPTDLENLRVLMQAEKDGQLDLETLMESMPVNTDATVLLERVKASRAENPAIAAAQRTAGLPEGPYLRMLQGAGLPVTPQDIQRAEDMADLGLNPPEPTPGGNNDNLPNV